MIRVEHLSNFGEALKELRWRARMKQVEVCRATGMTAPQVSRYENAHEMPTVESLVKYLSAVGAGLGQLEQVLIDMAGSGLPAGGPAAVEAAPAAAPPAAAEAADPLLKYRVGLDQIREDDDRRLRDSPGLRQVVGGLVELNVEGMERLEHRMKTLEEWMQDLKEAVEGRKAG